mgnify:CR=1 FL=1
MGFFKKIKEGLKKTRDAVVGQIDSMLKSFTKIDDELFEELEELLVMGDVGVPTAEKICKELRERVKKEGIRDPSEITSSCNISVNYSCNRSKRCRKDNYNR